MPRRSLSMDRSLYNWTQVCRGVSEKLRKLRLGVWLYGHPNDVKHFDNYNELPEDTKTRSSESARKIAHSFMEQLGYQSDLRHLELSFNAAFRCGTSPFLQLAVGPANGLDQLSKLSRLEFSRLLVSFMRSGLLRLSGWRATGHYSRKSSFLSLMPRTRQR
jgi:hypothetical protein